MSDIGEYDVANSVGWLPAILEPVTPIRLDHTSELIAAYRLAAVKVLRRRMRGEVEEEAELLSLKDIPSGLEGNELMVASVVYTQVLNALTFPDRSLAEGYSFLMWRIQEVSQSTGMSPEELLGTYPGRAILRRDLSSPRREIGSLRRLLECLVSDPGEVVRLTVLHCNSRDVNPMQAAVLAVEGGVFSSNAARVLATGLVERTVADYRVTWHDRYAAQADLDVVPD